ncbi:hypothetical protein MBLNU459_g7020t1 [Dothideomycetes sp. NU459]
MRPFPASTLLCFLVLLSSVHADANPVIEVRSVPSPPPAARCQLPPFDTATLRAKQALVSASSTSAATTQTGSGYPNGVGTGSSGSGEGAGGQAHGGAPGRTYGVVGGGAAAAAALVGLSFVLAL